jgi:apolipoprotein N-acyltransferase
MLLAMGTGQVGIMGIGSKGIALARYRVGAAFVLTALFVAVKAFAHDYWSVGFGLALLGVIALTPETTEHVPAWRAHAFRVVSACFVVVTLGSVWSALSGR